MAIDKIRLNLCCLQKMFIPRFLLAVRILELQPDFVNQKSLIEETIESHGHKVIFYPKFHCELNFIELFWGAAKQYT